MRDTEELRALREYDAGAPPLDAATRRRVWVRLYAAMTAEAAGNPPAPAVRRSRPVLRIALTATVAAAVAGGVLVAGQVNGSGGRTAASRAGNSPVLLNVSAQTVLDGAATYARQHEKAPVPRDDQFVYTKEIIKATNRATGSTTTYTDEDWRSVDGSQRSWIMEYGKGWWSEPAHPGETEWPPQDWGSLKKLPTNPEQLIRYLVPGAGTATPTSTPTSTPTPTPTPTRASLSGITDEQWSMLHFQLAGLLKLVPVMPDGLRPAAYEALAMIPGVKAVPDQQDAEGRTGIAITYDDPTGPSTDPGYGAYFVFDPKTYEYLGFRDHRTADDPKHTEFTDFSYLSTWSVVDHPKQHP